MRRPAQKIRRVLGKAIKRIEDKYPEGNISFQDLEALQIIARTLTLLESKAPTPHKPASEEEKLSAAETNELVRRVQG